MRRSLILIGLGLAMRAIPDFDLFDMRLYGVLQRIGLVYCAAAALYLWGSARVRWAAVGVLLFGYWALVAGDLSPDGNLGARIDRFLMGDRLWQGTWDPEGLLSTLPAIGTCLLGIFCGEWLRTDRSRGKIARGMWIAGAWLVVLGLAWDTVFPINKNLWSSSYVLFSAGTALLLFGAMYWAIDVKRIRDGWRGAWVTPFVVYGMNSIAVFVASGMFAKMLARIRVGGDGGMSLSAWLYENAFRSWAGDYGGSLAMALAQVVFLAGRHVAPPPARYVHQDLTCAGDGPFRSLPPLPATTWRQVFPLRRRRRRRSARTWSPSKPWATSAPAGTAVNVESDATTAAPTPAMWPSGFIARALRFPNTSPMQKKAISM